MAIIKKKTWPEAFEQVLSGKKKFDLDRYGQREDMEEKEIFIIQF